MKRTKWMLGSMVGALLLLPVACGGDEPVSTPSPSPEGQVGESEAASKWKVDLVDTRTTDCVTTMLFEITAAEAIDFVAVEASDELTEELHLDLLTINDQEQLQKLDIEAFRATTLVQEASASARQETRAAESSESATAAEELAVVDRHSFASSESTVLEESAVDREASASASTTKTNDFLQDSVTVVDQEVASEVAAKDAASLRAFESFTSFDVVKKAWPASDSSSSAIAKEDVEKLQLAKAAQAADLHFVDRDFVKSSSKEEASASEFVSEEAKERTLIKNEEKAELDEKLVEQSKAEAKQEEKAFAESIVETAESVLEELTEVEKFDQHALEKTRVFLTEKLEQDRLFLKVTFDSSVAKSEADIESALESASLRILTGTVSNVFADAIFDAPLACTIP